jgi:hypothetical protein
VKRPAPKRKPESGDRDGRSDSALPEERSKVFGVLLFFDGSRSGPRLIWQRRAVLTQAGPPRSHEFKEVYDRFRREPPDDGREELVARTDLINNLTLASIRRANAIEFARRESDAAVG